LSALNIQQKKNAKKKQKQNIDDKSLTPKEQIGCCRGSKQCKDQLITAAILQDCTSSQKDYQKAVASASHTPFTT